MIIAPNSTIRVLAGIPFSSDNIHVMDFNSASAQFTFFASKVVGTYDKCTYIRHEERVKVPANADDLYDCNYMMFQNTNYGSKWFYAFIDSIEYINNETCGIRFTIDPWQTWLFEIQIEPCYVEREHVATDTLGANTIPENIDYGPYIKWRTYDYTKNPAILIQSSGEAASGSVDANVYSGLVSSVYGVGNTGVVNDILQMLSETPEKIANLQMAVEDMGGHGGGLSTISETFAITRTLTFEFQGKSYKPKNNKLFCYPYCVVTVDNYNGNSETLRWENVNSNSMTSMQFQINGTPIPKPCMECYPTNYLGDAGLGNQDLGVQYDNFPMCAYIIDAYRAWVSQMPGAKAIMSTGSAVAGQLATGNIVGAVATTAMGAANYAIDDFQAKLHGTSIGGTAENAGMNYAQGRIGFRFIEYQIKPEFAEIVDNYFTRFGYAVRKIKTPETKSRENFNYVKCVDANIGGNIPNDAMNAIAGYFNRGLTIWHTSDIGNYTLRNLAFLDMQEGQNE